MTSMTGSVASEIPDLRGRVFIVTGGRCVNLRILTYPFDDALLKQ